MRKLVVTILDIVLDLLDLLPVLVYVEQRDSPDWNLQKPLHILFCDFAGKLVCKWSEAVEYSPLNLFGSLLGLNLLIDPLLDEDPVQSAGIEVFQKMGFPQLLLCPEDIHKVP